MPIGRLVQRFRWRRIVDKTVRYRWFPGHCKPSSRSLFVCKSPGNFLVIRVFVYVVHPAFLWVILGLACRGVCAGCIRYRFSRRPSLRPSLVFRSHASLPPSFVRWRRLFLRTRRAHLPFVRLGPPFVSFPPSFVRWRRFFLCTRRTHLPLVRHRSSVRVVPFLVRTVASVFPFARVAPISFLYGIGPPFASLPPSFVRLGLPFALSFRRLLSVFSFYLSFFRPAALFMLLLSIWFLG